MIMEVDSESQARNIIYRRYIVYLSDPHESQKLYNNKKPNHCKEFFKNLKTIAILHLIKSFHSSILLFFFNFFFCGVFAVFSSSSFSSSNSSSSFFNFFFDGDGERPLPLSLKSKT